MVYSASLYQARGMALHFYMTAHVPSPHGILRPLTTQSLPASSSRCVPSELCNPRTLPHQVFHTLTVPGRDKTRPVERLSIIYLDFLLLVSFYNTPCSSSKVLVAEYSSRQQLDAKVQERLPRIVANNKPKSFNSEHCVFNSASQAGHSEQQQFQRKN